MSVTKIQANKKPTTTIRISKDAHAIISDFISNECSDRKIGKFVEAAALKEIKQIRKGDHPFNFFNTSTLISNGWRKEGSSTYKRGENVVIYTGTNWYYNGEELTKDNYIEKIYDKIKAKL